jgi:hypothetical protein
MIRLRDSGRASLGRFLRRRLPAAVVMGLWLLTAGLNRPQSAAGDSAAPVPTVVPVGEAGGSMTSAQCAACHATVEGLSHPVKMAPTMAVPAGWPLEGGLINCTTCHVDTIGAHGQEGGAMLRGGGTGGAAFCGHCHVATSNSRQSQHPLVITRAHLLPPGGVVAGAGDMTSTGEGDGVNSCLACHDGAVAPDAYGGLGGEAGSRSGNSHPVGVAYPNATLRIGDATFRTAAVIDRSVRLTGGRVTCNACHSLYSRLPGLMVMRNDESRLCRNCHSR